MIKEHGGNIYKISRDYGYALDDILDFSANINPLGVPEKGRAAIAASVDSLVNYPDPDYYDFCTAVAKHHNLDASMVFPGNGAIDSLYSAVRAASPEKVLVSVPSFVEYEKAVAKADALYVPAYRKEEGGYRFDVETFLEQITEDVDLAILCNPNNPTGDLVSRASILRILEKCRSVGAYLLLDEAFMEFAEHLGAESSVDLLASHKELIVSRSLTKYYAVPGLRAGYLLVSDARIMDALRSNAEPWKLNALADAFSRAVLTDKAYDKATGEWIRTESAQLLSALNAFEDISAYATYGNYIFFRFAGNLDLKKEMLGRGIAIRSCDNYDGIGKGYYRVAVKDKTSNGTLIEILGEVLAG